MTALTFMIRKKGFWITLCIANLCIVALLGFGLRSKILFSLPVIDYRNLLSAHSHFAFAGWAGLSLITLLIFDLLAKEKSGKRIYSWILLSIEISSLGMAIVFPFYGYNAVSIFFSTLYIVASLVFAPIFIKDIMHTALNKNVKLLGISAIICLLISFFGTLGLIYILSGRSTDTLLYRDSIYTFLHFQYNGFFTLSIFALFLNYASKKNIIISKNARLFTIFLCLSVIPSLFLSLLWHNKILFYLIASIGCLLMVIALIYFLRFFFYNRRLKVFSSSIANNLWLFAALSFCLKLLLNVGTIIPFLGNAVYGDRPVIIGFLHLVFLGFMSFYLLANFVEQHYFTKKGSIISFPIIIFSCGIFANEFLLMVQGLGILFKTNSNIFNWLLWCAAIILFSGALLMLGARISIIKEKRT